MGIDISMSVGIGIHVTEQQVDTWLDIADPDDEYGVFEILENTVYSEKYPGLKFDSPNNSWVDSGYPNGFIIFADRVTQEWDMGREAEAGVFRPGANSITLEERNLLNAISQEITGKELAIEPLISVSVH